MFQKLNVVFLFKESISEKILTSISINCYCVKPVTELNVLKTLTS